MFWKPGDPIWQTRGFISGVIAIIAGLVIVLSGDIRGLVITAGGAVLVGVMYSLGPR